MGFLLLVILYSETITQGCKAGLYNESEYTSSHCEQHGKLMRRVSTPPIFYQADLSATQR